MRMKSSFITMKHPLVFLARSTQPHYLNQTMQCLVTQKKIASFRAYRYLRLPAQSTGAEKINNPISDISPPCCIFQIRAKQRIFLIWLRPRTNNCGEKTVIDKARIRNKPSHLGHISYT